MKIIRKAFKYRLDVNSLQDQKLTKFSDACRFVWNKALGMNLRRLQNGHKILWLNELQFWLKLWKESEEYSFLDDCHSQAIQAPIRALDRAFKDAFDKKQPNKKIPVFKKKGKSISSISYPQGFKIDEQKNIVFLPKIGWVKYRNSRNIIGTAKNVTVSKKGKYWFVSIQTEYEIKLMPHPSKSMVGIDMGVKRFATLSNGVIFQPLNSFKRLQTKLTKLQRQLKNKIKFSNNWKKLQDKIRKLHEKIANARHDYIHKATTEISNNHAIVVVEDLRIKNMTKSAKGTKDNPGKKVKQKSGLNKSILDQGWGMFFSQLEYKQSWLNGQVIKINPMRTSQECPCCGYISNLNRQSQKLFLCVECGFENNADDIASINIERRGHLQLACQVSNAVMLPAARTKTITALAAWWNLLPLESGGCQL